MTHKPVEPDGQKGASSRPSGSDVRTLGRLLLWWVWRWIPHTHGVKDMTFLGVYKPGNYEIWECNKCKFQEAL